jgi:hypothetical protein
VGDRRHIHGGNQAASAIVATISLFTRCTVPLPTPTSPSDLQYAVPGAQMVPDGVLDIKFLALLTHTFRAGEDSSSEDRSFLLQKNRRHPDHRTARGCRGADPLLVAIQGDAGTSGSPRAFAAPKPIIGPYHQNVVSTPHGILQHPVIVTRWDVYQWIRATIDPYQ